MSTSTEAHHVVRLEDYRSSEYLIPETKLTFVLHPAETRVVAELTIRRAGHAKKSAPLVLDGDGLTLAALAIDGRPAIASEYEASPKRLVLKKPPKNESFVLRIETVISPSTNTALMGLYQSNGVYCTQCEAEGFRSITYFLDRPDVLSVYTVRIEADAETAPLLLSNGNPVENGKLDGGRHFSVWHDPFPKPSYLFALVAGDLGTVSDSFVTASGREVALGIYVEHGKEPRAIYAMDALKRSMRWDEERFGREYDLDVFNIVAVSDFNIGAMENKGLNIFNDKYVLADAETATDADFAPIEAIIAHEYFHNWTGNRITCRDWFQLCLKEGLTVFRDHEFSADQRSRAVKRIAEVRALKGSSVPRGSGAARPPGAAAPLSRDQQLLHGDRLREGLRAGAHDPHHPRRRHVPRQHGPLLRAARRRRRDRRGLPRLLRRCFGPRPVTVCAMVSSAGHAGRSRQITWPRPRRSRSSWSRSCRPCVSKAASGFCISRSVSG
jgi:aminopeptidase N